MFLYFLRSPNAQVPLLVHQVHGGLLIIAEYVYPGWELTDVGFRLGLRQQHLDGIAGPGLLEEGAPAVQLVMAPPREQRRS